MTAFTEQEASVKTYSPHSKTQSVLGHAGRQPGVCIPPERGLHMARPGASLQPWGDETLATTVILRPPERAVSSHGRTCSASYVIRLIFLPFVRGIQ